MQRVNRHSRSDESPGDDKWFRESLEEQYDECQFQWNTELNTLEGKEYTTFTVKMPTSLVENIYTEGHHAMNTLSKLMAKAGSPSERLLAIAVYINKLEKEIKQNAESGNPSPIGS
jgi:hypothetical protein